VVSHWLLGSLRTLPFPADSIKNYGSSPHGLRCFLSAVTEQASPVTEVSEHLPWGLVPNCDIGISRFDTRGPKLPPLRAPPSGFLTLSASAPCQNPCGLVSCHSHIRGSPSRGFPSRAAAVTFRQPHTLMPLSKFAYQPESWRQRPSTRLQGFNPPVESVSSGTDVTPHKAPIPSWDFTLPRVFLPPALETATRLLLP